MRAFSEREKEVIKTKLIKAAEKLFAEQGFGKTNVAELSQAAGIGKGTFYMFYKSKDELMWDLHKALHAEWEGRFEAILARMAIDPQAAIVDFMRTAFGIFTHPLILKLQQTGDFDRVYRTLSNEELDKHSDMSLSIMVPLVEMAQHAGAVIDGDPRVLAATIRSVCVLGLHRTDIGEDVYPAVVDLLITLVAKGLSKRREEND